METRSWSGCLNRNAALAEGANIRAGGAARPDPVLPAVVVDDPVLREALSRYQAQSLDRDRGRLARGDWQVIARPKISNRVKCTGDRRRAFRVPFCCGVRFSDGVVIGSGEIFNISATGLAMTTRLLPALGAVVAGVFHPDGMRSSPPVGFRARTVRRLSRGDESGVAIEFADVIRQHRRILERLVDRVDEWLIDQLLDALETQPVDEHAEPGPGFCARRWRRFPTLRGLGPGR